MTIPKTFKDGPNRVPYVSSQAWKRWLRNTLIEETGWPASELTAIGQSAKQTTVKIAGKLDPVDFPEDDIFGYMRAESGQGKRRPENEESENPEPEETGEKGGKKVKACHSGISVLCIDSVFDSKNWLARQRRGLCTSKRRNPVALYHRVLQYALARRILFKLQSSWSFLEYWR